MLNAIKGFEPLSGITAEHALGGEFKKQNWSTTKTKILNQLAVAKTTTLSL